MRENTSFTYKFLTTRNSQIKKSLKKSCWPVNLMNDLLLFWVISEQLSVHQMSVILKRMPTTLAYHRLAYYLTAYQRSCLILWSWSAPSSSSPVDQFGSDRKCPECLSQRRAPLFEKHGLSVKCFPITFIQKRREPLKSV